MDLRLYKYQPINERRINNLLKNQLYFSNPKDFKDPDDCKIQIYYEGTERKWIEHYKRNHGYSENKIKNIIQQALNKGFFQKKDNLILYDPEYEGHSEAYRNLLHGGMHVKSLPLVTCFCGDPDNAYMWRDYADNQKGFCLCFKSTSMKDQLHTLTFNSKEEYIRPVIYEKMPQTRLNFLNPEDRAKIDKRLITKNPEYITENEYRIMISTQRNLNIYRRKELESIIFGFHIDLKKEMEIYDIAKRIYNGINFYKVADIQNDDKVKIKLIDVDTYFKFLQ